MNSPRRMRRSGFTLIELLLVMAIIAVLAGILAPRLSGSRAKADKTKAIAEITSMKTALQAFNVDMGQFPAKLDDLIVKPNVEAGHEWNGPYLDAKAVPMDPWGRPYFYQTPGSDGADFDLYSNGPDGQTRITP